MYEKKQNNFIQYILHKIHKKYTFQDKFVIKYVTAII